MDFRSLITQVGVPVVTTARALTVSAPLTGGGDLSADRGLGLSVDGTLQVVAGALGVSALVSLATHTHTPAALGAEPTLGSPGTNAYVLTSTTGGVRSWAAPTVAWGGVTGKPTTLAGYAIADAQALDGDLTAIAALAGFSGLLRKNDTNTWALDTSAYLTAITSLLVTNALGFTPYNATNPSGYITSAGNAATASAVAWSGVTGKPTTLAGYSISDAASDAELLAHTGSTSNPHATTAAQVAALPLAGGTMSGAITFSTGRKGLIGLYDATNTQQIFAMGLSYVLPDGGASTNYGAFYGLGWSYNPDYGVTGNNPQSKAGLNHQLLIMNNGVTQTAIGTGIWTLGAITATGATLGGNVALHAGNYSTYTVTKTGVGASGASWNIGILGNAATATWATGSASTAQMGSYTADSWLRTAGVDAYQFRIYGNSRTVIFRTDGVTNAGTGGAYPFIFYYGDDYLASNRKMIIHTDGTIWTPAYGWLSTMSISGSAGSVPWSGVTSKPTTLGGYGISDALPLSGGNLTGGLSASYFSAPYMAVSGASSGYQFYDRTLSTMWVWYASGGYAKLWFGSDLVQVTQTGCMAVRQNPWSGCSMSIKATGTTSATYGIIVVNSSGGNTFWTRDDGYIWAAASPIQYSDARRKREIADIDRPLALIQALRPRSFVMRDDPTNRVRYGIIAQEALTIVPNLLTFDTHPGQDEPEYSMDYTGLIGPLLGAVQELAARVAQLEAR